jgi:hypothetical protein
MLAGMRNNPGVIRAAAAAVLAFPCIAAAAESHRCSGVLEDAQRLACYDTAFGKPMRPAASSAAPAPAPAVVTPAPVVQRSAPAPALPAAAPPAPSAATAPAASAPPAQPVSARITAVSRLSNDRFAITLDNGQVWTQLERDLAAEVHAGDTIQIKPAMLGSWMLETRGGVKTRVKLAR